MKRTIAAMTVDTPAASYDLPGTEYTFYMNPQVSLSYTDALIKQIAGAYFDDRRPWHWKENEPGTDSYLGDPTVDVPDVWSYSGTGIVTHHNSEDKPATVDPRSMHDLISIIASYLYFNANAGEHDIAWLSQITIAHVRDEMDASVAKGLAALQNRDATLGSYELARINYFEDRGRDAFQSMLRLVPQDRRQSFSASQARYVADLHSVAVAEDRNCAPPEPSPSLFPRIAKLSKLSFAGNGQERFLSTICPASSGAAIHPALGTSSSPSPYIGAMESAISIR